MGQFSISANIDGVKPSILSVKDRIGGGSYSTVKRHLDAWLAERLRSEDAGINAPESVIERGNEFARALWAIAVREAEKGAAVVKEAAENAVAQVTDDLEIAQSEIGRLEGVEQGLATQLAASQAKLSAADKSISELTVRASKTDDLQQRLAAAEEALAAERAGAQAKAVEAARLQGECDALRKQVHDLTAALSDRGTDKG